MSPISRRTVLAVVLVTVMLTAFIAVPLQAATYVTPLPHPPPGGGCGTYVVRFGDTLSSIARRFGVSVWTLASVNGIHNINRIWAGQRLRIPCGGGTGHPHPGGWYRVVCGDTVSRIAARFGVSIWQIINANHLRFPYTIYVGQWLRI